MDDNNKSDAQPITNPPPYTSPIPQMKLPMPREFNGKKYYGAADVAKIIGVYCKTPSNLVQCSCQGIHCS